MADERRTKPRVSIVLTPADRESGDALAAARGVSLSTLLAQLIREEAARAKRRVGHAGG